MPMYPPATVKAIAALFSMLTLAACTTPSALAQVKDDSTMNPIIHAPDFPKDFAWLNTNQPLSFKSNLKGQVVVMDFWCYCCINCMHVIPDLEALEQKYKDQPVVILGVHSNKYDNEADPANIRAAIQRYEIHHPVIVDQDHKIWDSYDVHSWPTIVVVGADGNIIGGVSGEGHRDLLDKVISQALADAKKAGTLAAAPLQLPHEGEVRAASGLSFPGKVIADATGNHLIVIDSNHNRIVIASYPDASGKSKVEQIIGSGKQGHADGDFAAATFNRPQGGVVSGNILYIADTENHLIRRADLAKKTVTTILGTGKQDFDPEAGKSGRAQGLNSPWDLAIGGGGGNRLYISQAGQHQLFAMNLMTGMTEVAAGTSREDIADGPAARANLAQPSGLALDAKNQILYFADSEVSAVRELNLKTQEVSTIVGHGLFTFGDLDGAQNTALLQHALGVTLSADGSKLYVADTYNHKIKTIDPVTSSAVTLAGTGKSGTGGMGQPIQFFEPASVSTGSATELFIADTDNHRIVRLNPASGEWKEITFEGLDMPGVAENAVAKDAKDIGPQPLKSGQPLNLNIALALPASNHLTEGAPISLKVTDGTHTIYSTTLSAPAVPGAHPKLSATIPADVLAANPQSLYVTVFYTHCSEGLSAVCTPAQSSWKITPTFFAAGSASTVDLP
jgi:sugar lactone lactonase YvrE/peroxiredoxin